jgi:hypothetical protein
MKSKKLAVVTLIIGILLIIGGLSLWIISYINEKNTETKQLEDEILTNYEVFKEKTEAFNDFRSNTYYNEVTKDLYLESVSDEYEVWINILDIYTDTIDEVENSSSYLKENCVNTYYSNNDIKNKCEAFVIAYETVVNYYTKDIISFNELINEYINNNDSDIENIKEYNLKYEYVDINSDGKFIGKD